MTRPLVLIAAAVVLVANSWAVFSTLQNRGSAPGGTLELTEREVRLEAVSDDSTALLLGLRWEVETAEDDREYGAAAWLNAAKLQELGFDCSVPADHPHAREHYQSRPAVLLYLVLEFDGETSKRAKPSRASRLFAVDAGRDAQKLRARYPDSARYAICRGVIKPFLKDRNHRENRPLPQPRLAGRIQDLFPQELFVPSTLVGTLQPFRHAPDRSEEKGEQNLTPRYAVTLSWGSRYEPWLSGARVMSAATQTK